MNKLYTNKVLKHALTGAILLACSLPAFAESDPTLWTVMKEAYFGKRAMLPAEFMTIEAPRRAESGAQVPVTYTIDNKAANGIKIVKLYSFVDANPIPLTATYHLTDALGDFNMQTRIRFETDAFVRLVGEDEKGILYIASKEIRAAGGCGGTVDGDEAAMRASAGKIKMKVDFQRKLKDTASATFNIKHPMRTGLQRELVSQGFIPAFYINKTEFKYNGKPVMTVDVGVGTAEDPYFKFNFIADEQGKFEVIATDNESKSFSNSVEINSLGTF